MSCAANTDDYKREIIELVGDRPLLCDSKNLECRAIAYGRRGLACGMACVDKSCVKCRVSSTEGAPNGYVLGGRVKRLANLRNAIKLRTARWEEFMQMMSVSLKI